MTDQTKSDARHKAAMQKQKEKVDSAIAAAAPTVAPPVRPLRPPSARLVAAAHVTRPNAFSRNAFVAPPSASYISHFLFLSSSNTISIARASPTVVFATPNTVLVVVVAGGVVANPTVIFPPSRLVVAYTSVSGPS